MESSHQIRLRVEGSKLLSLAACGGADGDAGRIGMRIGRSEPLYLGSLKHLKTVFRLLPGVFGASTLLI
jgi:hypothetical protein